MKKIITVFLAVGLMVSLASCAKPVQKSDKMQIVTSLFPQYDFARQVAGDAADVTLLLDAGVEAHTYDPTYRDISKIGQADLFIYTGDSMEPWAKKVFGAAQENKDLTVLDLSKSVDMIKEDHDHEEGNEDHHHEYDPHIWLDMKNAVKMLESITDALCSKSPGNTELFMKNSEKLKEQLEDLDSKFNSFVSSQGDRTIVFGGRFAYKYFTEAYHLNYKTVYESCSTDVEPSAKRVSEITDFMKTNNIRYIFHEELADPKVAKSIAEATGAELLEFSTAHNLSKSDFDSGVTFVDIMNRNLENLKKGLEL